MGNTNVSGDLHAGGDMIIGGDTNKTTVIQYLPGSLTDSDIAKSLAGTDKSKRVWIIHGRNDELTTNVFMFLRTIGLDPIEWCEARSRTGVSSPYIGEILKAGFDYAQAFVVLLTGDDEAKLREEYIKDDDPEYECNLTPQARQNVIFEAGMAFGIASDKIVFVQQGKIRPFSNISGIHILKLNNTPEARFDFASRLRSAGCDLPDLINRQDWLKAGNFESSVSEQSMSKPGNHASSLKATKSVRKNPEMLEPPKLSKEAKTLLKEASLSNGTIMLPGWGIQVGMIRRMYGEDLAPRERATWDEAIDELEKIDLIKAEGHKREVFRVTDRGYKVADQIES